MIGRGLRGRDFITLRDFSRQEIETMLEVGLQIKGEAKIRRTHRDVLPGRTLLMMFFNPSLRTHNSFEAGIFQLGGHAHFLEPSSARLPTLEGEDVPYQSERITDVARVLSRMGDAIAIRVLGDAVGWEYDKSLTIINEFAKYADVPVINMEDNKYHPNQGMADVMTLWEYLGRDLRGRKLAVSWTYSPSTKKPVAPHHDFMYAASYFGPDIVFAHPPEMSQLFDKYRGWIADEKHMRMAKASAFYMHCLPCERGYEVSDAVLDDPKWGTPCYDEAENRLHAQKGVMACIIP